MESLYGWSCTTSRWVRLPSLPVVRDQVLRGLGLSDAQGCCSSCCCCLTSSTWCCHWRCSKTETNNRPQGNWLDHTKSQGSRIILTDAGVLHRWQARLGASYGSISSPSSSSIPISRPASTAALASYCISWTG